MNKNLYSALINEINNEILFITFNFNVNYLTRTEINKLEAKDYKEISSSKYLKKLIKEFLEYSEEIGDYITPDEISILEKGEFNKSNLIYLYDKMTPYLESYIKLVDKFGEMISDTLDTKRLSGGYTGKFPIYMILEEGKLTLERAYVLTNAKSVLNKSSKKFGFYVSYVDYDIKLDNYHLDGFDLREKTIEEIIDYVDKKSFKFDMNSSTYYETDTIEFRDNMEYSLGELSFFLDKKKQTFNGLKAAFKQSFKTVGLSILILIVFLVGYFLYRYFIRR